MATEGQAILSARCGALMSFARAMAVAVDQCKKYNEIYVRRDIGEDLTRQLLQPHHPNHCTWRLNTFRKEEPLKPCAVGPPGPLAAEQVRLVAARAIPGIDSPLPKGSVARSSVASLWLSQLCTMSRCLTAWRGLKCQHLGRPS